MAEKSKKYVVHYCKNKECNNCWIDEDITNVKNKPPKWKYCAECCEKHGFVNPERPELSDKQKEVLKRNQFKPRKNALESDETQIYNTKEVK